MNTRLVALGIIALVLIVVFGALFGGFIVSGYGGLSTRIHSIEHQYPRVESVDIVLGETTATIHPDTLGPLGATGLRLELGQPQYKSDDIRYTKTITEEQEDGSLNRTWAAHIAYFDLFFTIITESPGTWAITDITFWIELQENQFNVFDAPDAVEAYILEVVTTENVGRDDPSLVDVTPLAEGFNFDMLAVESHPIPEWMSDSGYQGVLSELKHVRFSVHVNSMSPFVLGMMRQDHYATWSCEVRALVFGYWEVYSPYDEWDFPDPWNFFAFLDDIFAGLSIIVGLAVGILLSIAIIKFIPDKRIATIILVCAWAVIVLMFGFLELLA